jgi:hypothetical protein
MVRDPMTRRVEYIGPVVNAAARITALAHGGQVLVSEAAQRKMGLKSLCGDDAGEQATKKFVALGRFEMPDAPKGSSHSSHSSQLQSYAYLHRRRSCRRQALRAEGGRAGGSVLRWSVACGRRQQQVSAQWRRLYHGRRFDL